MKRVGRGREEVTSPARLQRAAAGQWVRSGVVEEGVAHGTANLAIFGLQLKQELEIS